MTLYLLMASNGDHCPDFLLGVYSTIDEAQKQSSIAMTVRHPYRYHMIKECVLDDAVRIDNLGAKLAY